MMGAAEERNRRDGKVVEACAASFDAAWNVVEDAAALDSTTNAPPPPPKLTMMNEPLSATANENYYCYHSDAEIVRETRASSSSGKWARRDSVVPRRNACWTTIARRH